MSHDKDPKDESKLDDNVRFADLLDSVKPLHEDHHNRADIQAPKPKPTPTPKQTLKDEQQVLKESLK